MQQELKAAMLTVPWRARCENEVPGDGTGQVELQTLIEWQPHEDLIAPPSAEIWYDSPVSFNPPVHEVRMVERNTSLFNVGQQPMQWNTPTFSPPRADYKAWEDVREKRICDRDKHLCVFCKSPLTKNNTTVHHTTYRHAGKDDYLAARQDSKLAEERINELRSLCRLCHDAVTMIEYGLGMGLDRINPEEERWRKQIIEKRQEIIAFRSLETRRRRLSPEEVE